MSGAAPRFRYKREGAEARAWKVIALRLERAEARATMYPQWFDLPRRFDSLCTFIADCPVNLRHTMRQRVWLFKRRNWSNYLHFWPTACGSTDERGAATDRITAAWLCYWMAREEGK